MKLFPSTYIREIDNYTIENEPIDSIDLMERAATCWLKSFQKYYSNSQEVFVFAGPGNNGGDALAISRMLLARQYKVRVFLLAPSGKLSKDCSVNLERLKKANPDCLEEIDSAGDIPILSAANIIIDGLFGSGLSRKVEGLYADLISNMNSSGAEIVSIDIPSGLFGEDNIENDYAVIIKASRTFTFQFPFLSFFFAENDTCVGRWEAVNIGLHPDIIRKTTSAYSLLERPMISQLLKPRKRFSHKGSFGHALLIAGSKGMSGAAILAGKAGLRGGAGLVSVHLPSASYLPVQTAAPELIVSVDPEEDFFTEVPELDKYSAIGLGPGLGLSAKSRSGIKQVLSASDKPLLIDADGLNHLSQNPGLLDKLPPGAILTPHPGEFDRLFGKSESSWHRHEMQKECSDKYGIIIVLKGAFTGVSLPGNYYFNSTGNPGMATGGSGDVLSGLIVSLLAVGLEPKDAALAGVYLHGLAGDIAAKKHGQDSMIAGDIIEALGDAFKIVKSTPDLHEGRIGGVNQ